jgi:hypothetical protein
MTGIKRSIATEYEGITFRSKLEADYARCFDALGVEWRYEPKGQYFGDQFYLVDFYLPRSRQWVEVKGVFEPADVRKIAALLEHVPARPFTDEDCPDIALVACVPDGHFVGWARGVVSRYDDLLTLSRRASRDVELLACTECEGWWFGDIQGSWKCQCCGANEGGRHILSSVGSPLPEFPNVHALHFASILQ